MTEFVQRRPLLFASLFFVAGILCFRFFPHPAVFLLPIFLCLAVVRAFLRHRRLFFLIGLLISLGAFRLAITDFKNASDIRFHASPTQSVVYLAAKIVTEPEERPGEYGEKKTRFTAQAERLWGKDGRPRSVKGKVEIYLKDAPALRYGDEFVAEGHLAAPEPPRNPGGFDAETYYRTRGIGAIFYGAKRGDFKILTRNGGNPLIAGALGVRKFLSEALTREFGGNDAAFLKALFLGERGDFDEEFRELFFKTGTMHILAVSGFNIGFLATSLLFILRPFPFSRNTELVIVLIAVWLYCLLVGWQAPLVRASWMASLFILGRLLGRKTDILNTLGFAGLVILAVNPMQLFDIGFQLSFLAVGAIAVLMPIFHSKPLLLPNERLSFQEKIRFYFTELFWVSFVCLIVTQPVITQNFYIATPLALIANLFVVPLAFLLFFFGFVYFLTFAWMPAFLKVIPFLMKLLMKALVCSLQAVESLPGAAIITGPLGAPLLALLIAGGIYLLFTKRISSAAWRALLVCAFILNIFLLQDVARLFYRGFSMTVMDVGQGDAIYLEFPHGGNMLIDAGKGGAGDEGRRSVVPFLKSKGVRELDALVISHAHEDHIGGMPAVLKEFKVKNVIDAGVPYKSRLYEGLKSAIRREKARVLRAAGGLRLEGFRDADIFILNPPSKDAADENLNNDSIVFLIRYKENSFLLTGDISEKAMQDLLSVDLDLRADILKVPHHGAKFGVSGNEFMRRVSPRVSIISVGRRNMFKHPSNHTLSVLRSVPGNRIFRTDRDNAIRIDSDGQRLSVSR